MSELTWPCPHCGTLLKCDESKASQNLSCCNCGKISCPQEVLQSALAELIAPMVRQEQRVLRQRVREFRTGLKDSFHEELQQLLWGLNNLEVATAGTEASQLASLLCDQVEDELDTRVHETGWDQAKRLARRGTRATVDWLKTDEGKAVTKGAAVVAAIFGINFLG